MSDNAPALPRVLIIDDSRIVRASIIKHIKGTYDFREEPDGEAGWQTLLLDPSIQVVISDISMPKLDGFELLQRIRASKVSRVQEIPVIVISGDEEDAARIRAKELGATDFINKGIGNVEYHAADLFADGRGSAWADARYDLLLLDPPRAGAEQVLAYLPRREVRRVVYVSCHPASLARDAGILVRERGFVLSAAGVMDMFPHTAHVESIAVFDRA